MVSWQGPLRDDAPRGDAVTPLAIGRFGCEKLPETWQHFASNSHCFVTGAIRGHHAARAGIGALGKPFRVHELHAAVDELLAWGAGDGVRGDDRLAALRTLEQGFLVGP